MKRCYLFRTLSTVALFLTAVGSAAYAQVTVDYSATVDSILDTNGSLAPIGDAVLLGNFPSGFDFSTHQTYASLTASGGFTQFDSTTISSPGKFADEVIFQTGSPALGKQLYIWILNNPDPTQATAWVILTNNDTTSQWFVPNAPPDFVSPDTSDIGVVIPSGAFGVGVFNAAEPNGTNKTDWKMTSMAAIPEPSTYALIGLGALGMVGLRRRIKR